MDIFCDHCADLIKDKAGERWVPSLPRDIDSANKGESAVICEDCYTDYLEL